MSATRLLALCLTDVEGSSPLWREHPAAMPEVISALDAIVTRATCSHGGTVVKSRGEGDSHFLVFPLVSDAVHAAASMQRDLTRATWPDGIELRIRMALHTGEVREHAGDYLGLAINRTARLRSLAHGGQIVASTAVAELTTDLLDDGLAFVSLGPHRVRDFTAWTEVFQLCGPDLPHDFPPLAELAAANGQYLKQTGDGCLGLFADPDHALAFVRATQDRASALGVAVRGAVHVGRVEFAHHEPVGDAMIEAVTLLRAARRSGCTQVLLSAAASLLANPADDLVTAGR
jgi:class 3 adenylate cyclase